MTKSKNEQSKIEDYASRALAGISGGLTVGVPFTAAQLGITGLGPTIRKIINTTPNVPENFRTDTLEQLGSLAERLVLAGGRDPDDVARPVHLRPMKNKAGEYILGHAGISREFVKGKPAEDILNLSMKLSPEAVAHEVGHITGSHPKLRDILARFSIVNRRVLPSAIAPALALSGALTSKDDVPIYAKAAPYIGAAQFASILGEEIRANIQAAKILKNIGYKLPLSGKLKMYLPTLSYLGRGAALIGAPLGILKGIQLYNESKKKGYPFSVKNLLIGGTPSSLSETPTPEEFREKWKGKV